MAQIVARGSATKGCLFAVVGAIAVALAACGSGSSSKPTTQTATEFASPTLRAAASVGAFDSPTPVSLVDALVGKFRTTRYGEMTLDFSKDGQFEENLLSCSPAAASNGCSPFQHDVGTFRIAGTVVTFIDDAGPCQGMPGVYLVEVGTSITLHHELDDPCLGRQSFFDGRWDAAQ